MSTKTRSSKRSTAAKAAPELPHSVFPPGGEPSKVENAAASVQQLSRNMERNEIASLNDRFAALIEYNRQLESVNKMLRQKDAQIKETEQRTMERLRATYDRELAEIRGKGETLKEETAKLRMDHTKLELEFNEKKGIYGNLSKDVAKQRRELNEVKDRVVHCSVTIPQVESENERLAKEKIDMEQERNEMVSEVEIAMRLLEQEKMARVHTENLLQEKLEDLKLEDEAHEEEMKQLVSTRQREMKEADGQLRQNYDSKLQESLQGLRKEYDEKLRSSTQSLAVQREAMGGIKAEMKTAQHELHHVNVETLMVKNQLESIQKKNAEFEKERQGLMQTVHNMEHKSYIDHHVFGKMLAEKDFAIETYVAEKEELVNDTQVLMASKLAVDNEIATYRKLMDGADQL